jgi:hypothetical protein
MTFGWFTPTEAATPLHMGADPRHLPHRSLT